MILIESSQGESLGLTGMQNLASFINGSSFIHGSSFMIKKIDGGFCFKDRDFLSFLDR